MKTRYVTYDVSDGNDYTKLYDWFDEIGAEQITESTYKTKTNLNQTDFENKLKSLIKKDDKVVYISTNKNDQIFDARIM